MSREHTIQMAKTILDDFYGGCFYADPEILAGVIKTPLKEPEKARHIAVEILRKLLLRWNAQATNRDEELEYLANFLAPEAQLEVPEEARGRAVDLLRKRLYRGNVQSTNRDEELEYLADLLVPHVSH